MLSLLGPESRIMGLFLDRQFTRSGGLEMEIYEEAREVTLFRNTTTWSPNER